MLLVTLACIGWNAVELTCCQFWHEANICIFLDMGRELIQTAYNDNPPLNFIHSYQLWWPWHSFKITAVIERLILEIYFVTIFCSVWNILLHNHMDVIMHRILSVTWCVLKKLRWPIACLCNFFFLPSTLLGIYFCNVHPYITIYTFTHSFTLLFKNTFFCTLLIVMCVTIY